MRDDRKVDVDRHYRSMEEECDGCGARWIPVSATVAVIGHSPGCPVLGWWEASEERRN